MTTALHSSPSPNIGHNWFSPLENYIESDESKQVVVAPFRPLIQCLREIPAHYLWDILSNNKLNECCRAPESLEMEVRKSQDIEMQEPDLYVFQCGCGRKHRRLLVDSLHIGDQEKKPEKIHNPYWKNKK